MTTALVLAGGLGTRLRSEVPNLPKPMAPVNGKPFLEYLIDYWSGQGIEKFIFCVGYRAEIIKEWFGTSYRGVRIEYSEEESPLGTGGAILQALKLLDENIFLLLNGDTFFPVGLRSIRELHEVKNAALVMSLFSSRDGSRYMSVEIESSGRVNGLNTVPSNDAFYANGGVYMLDKTILRDFTSLVGSCISFEGDIIPHIFKKYNSIFGCPSSAQFIDIGIPNDYRRAALVLNQELLSK